MKYKISFAEFLEGKWLNEIKTKFAGYEKVDVNYKGDYLLISGYAIKSKGVKTNDRK